MLDAAGHGGCYMCAFRCMGRPAAGMAGGPDMLLDLPQAVHAWLTAAAGVFLTWILRGYVTSDYRMQTFCQLADDCAILLFLAVD